MLGRCRSVVGMVREGYLRAEEKPLLVVVVAAGASVAVAI